MVDSLVDRLILLSLLDSYNSFPECSQIIMLTSQLLSWLLQLFKSKEEGYLLDLQRLEGPPFLFLELCAAFLTKLRI